MLEYLLVLIACIASLGIAWSDFQVREIHIGWFAAVGLAGIGFQIVSKQADLVFDIIFNGLSIALMVGGIWVTYRIKGEKQIMDKLLGWGDVAMMFAMGIWLPSLPFLMLFTATCFLVLLIIVLLQKRKKVKKDFPIPLAGALGLAFVPVCIWEVAYPICW